MSELKDEVQQQVDDFIQTAEDIKKNSELRRIELVKIKHEYKHL